MTNYQEVKNAIIKHNPDIIINCAANVGSVNYVSTYPADIISENTAIHVNLYKAVNDVNKSIIVVNPLANCSYPGNATIQKESEWWNGEMHESVEAFGITKKIAYVISKSYEKQYGIKTINLMLGGGYGEYDHLDETRTHAMNGIVIRMIKAQNKGEKEFVVWGTGTPIREWVYMADVAKLIKLIMDNQTYNLPNPLNVGQNHGISIADIVHTVSEGLDYTGAIVYDTSKQDGAPVKILSADAFQKHFPEFTFTPLSEGITNTINFYKNKL
jgi:GDP-L-fucose synthase